MQIIYLVGKSPFNTRTLETYFSTCKLQARDQQDVVIIFLQDGVLIAPRGNTLENQLLDIKRDGGKVFFRQEDLSARGIPLPSITTAGTPIDTKKIMGMLANAKTIVSLL